jgi:hypothetical protein
MEDNKLIVDAVDFSDVEAIEEAFAPVAQASS